MDLEQRVADLIDELCPGPDTQPTAAARAIIPIVMEEAATVAEQLNGWGSPPSPELANHIAKAIRSFVGDGQ
jgi:hypothetical protein